jgi:hypothetical protein
MKMDDRLARILGEMDEDDPRIRDLDVIRAALSRARLTTLEFGQVIRQKKLGTGYRYKGDDAPVIFVRYTTPADYPVREDGKVIHEPDIIVADCVDGRDGEVLLFALDSSFFEIVE